jgi:bacillithiol system protein YtxJ
MIKKVNSADELSQLFERSKHEPVVLFKHSNRCGISSHVLEMASGVETEVHVIVVQDHRDLSNQVAAITGYTHQSPQVFVLVDGKPAYHATHYAIDPAAINAAVRENMVIAAE